MRFFGFLSCNFIFLLIWTVLIEYSKASHGRGCLDYSYFLSIFWYYKLAKCDVLLFYQFYLYTHLASIDRVQHGQSWQGAVWTTITCDTKTPPFSSTAHIHTEPNLIFRSKQFASNFLGCIYQNQCDSFKIYISVLSIQSI